jgi:tetratricopeptide (TPR) repeat protein
MLGRCQLALEQYGGALDNLRVAAELGPDDPANAATLSRALMALGRHTETRELLEGLDFEKLSPAWKVEVARMLARCLLAEDRAADAVALLETRLADDPDNAALHRAIARAYQATDDRAAVLDHLARAFALDPDDHASGRAAATTALALAEAAGDDGLAASFHGRALELAAELATAAPEYEHALLAGEAALGTHQLEIAADWFAAAVKDRPQEPEARFCLGRTLAALGRNDEAIAQLRAALGAAPEDELAVRIHDELGRLLACRLELPEAARHYRAGGDGGRADRIDELAAGFNEALGRLATLRSDASELAEMEARLEGLADADGVAAVARLRKARGREIAEIEDNLAEVRAALCQ